MGKYRKRPVVIEAEQVLPDHPLPSGVHPWPDENGGQPRDRSAGYIDTLEGRMHVPFGAWRLIGIKGEVYCCADDIFQASYEPVEE